MSGQYNAGSSPARVVLVNPNTLVDYSAQANGVTETVIVADGGAIGTAADVPWSGTGPGTVIAILKGIYANTATT